MYFQWEPLLVSSSDVIVCLANYLNLSELHAKISYSCYICMPLFYLELTFCKEHFYFSLSFDSLFVLAE